MDKTTTMPLTTRIKTQRQQRRKKEGGCCTTTTKLFKVVWSIALVSFLISIGIMINMANDVTPAPSYREEQLADRPLKKLKRKTTDHRRRRSRSPMITETEVVNPEEKNENHNQHLRNDKSSISSTDEGDILKWLRQRSSSSNNNNNTPHNNSSSLSDLLSSPLNFAPGSLPLSQLSTLRHCYADPSIYRNHFKEKDTRRIPYSEKHNLAYIMLPKSGSSTGRFMMKHEFDAVERQVKLKPPMNAIAFVRDPLSRFYSQYEEAYVRTAPWHNVQNPYYAKDDKNDDGENNAIKSNNRKSATSSPPHPFPYLYDNLHSYRDYEDVFCPKHTRSDPNSYRECTFAQSQENGTLASRLERFVRDYDGRSPYDIHLALQVPLLSNARDGRAIHVTELYNTTDAGREWHAIAERHLGDDATWLQNAKKERMAGTKESHGGVIQGRSYPRRLDVSLVGREAERRIVELALLDYCCLNFPLPKTIAEEVDGRTDLNCKMDYDGGTVRIQPAIFPDTAIK